MRMWCQLAALTRGVDGVAAHTCVLSTLGDVQPELTRRAASLRPFGPSPASAAQLIPAPDESNAKARRVLERLDDASMLATWRLTAGGGASYSQCHGSCFCGPSC